LVVHVSCGSTPEVELADADFRFAPDSRHPAVGLACPFGADIVAKVENRTIPKISRKRIFRRLYRCNAL
jgi:hypothetical protein